MGTSEVYQHLRNKKKKGIIMKHIYTIENLTTMERVEITTHKSIYSAIKSVFDEIWNLHPISNRLKWMYQLKKNRSVIFCNRKQCFQVWIDRNLKVWAKEI